MRRWIRAAARLYPPQWRRRYGAEFEALLEDAPADLREFFNVLGGALTMRMTTMKGVLELAGAMALAGAVAAVAIAVASPRIYVATATLRILNSVDTSGIDVLGTAERDVLNGARLLALVQQPSLGLYPGENKTGPRAYELVDRMRNRDLSIRLSADRQFVTVSFRYPDRYKAQSVAHAIAARLAETAQAVAAYHGRLWATAWGASEPLLPQPRFELVQQATPADPVAPNWLAYAAAGLGIGLAAGLIAGFTMRSPRRSLQMAAFAAAGCAIALAIAWWMPRTYRSQAVLRLVPRTAPARVLQELPRQDPHELIAALTQKVLSRDNLARIVKDPRRDLYKQERQTQSLDTVLQQMRNRAISVRELPPAGKRAGDTAAILISFEYPDRYKAQVVVHELVTDFTESTTILALRREGTSPVEMRRAMQFMGGTLEVLDPANLPQAPLGPRTPQIAAAGLAGGMLLGGLWLAVRRQRLSTPFPAVRN